MQYKHRTGLNFIVPSTLELKVYVNVKSIKEVTLTNAKAFNASVSTMVYIMFNKHKKEKIATLLYNDLARAL